MKRTTLVARDKDWFAQYEYKGEKLEVIGRTIADCERLARLMVL